MSDKPITGYRRIANSYAQALYEVALARQQVYQVKEELTILCELLKKEPDLLTIFNAPSITIEQCKLFVDQISEGFSDTVIAFLDVLNRRRRLGLIPEIAEVFVEIDNERNNRLETAFYTVEEVDKFLKEEIESVLNDFFKKELLMEYKTSPELLGGFVVRAGDLMIDASVRSRLQEIKTDLLRRGRDEIQSGRNFVGD